MRWGHLLWCIRIIVESVKKRWGLLMSLPKNVKIKLDVENPCVVLQGASWWCRKPSHSVARSAPDDIEFPRMMFQGALWWLINSSYNFIRSIRMMWIKFWHKSNAEKPINRQTSFIKVINAKVMLQVEVN